LGDNIGQSLLARRKTRDNSNMIGLERMVHADQDGQTQQSYHATLSRITTIIVPCTIAR